MGECGNGREPRLNSWVIQFIMAWWLSGRVQKSFHVHRVSWFHTKQMFLWMYSMRFDWFQNFSLSLSVKLGKSLLKSGCYTWPGSRENFRNRALTVWAGAEAWGTAETVSNASETASDAWGEGPAFKAVGLMGWWMTGVAQRDSQVPSCTRRQCLSAWEGGRLLMSSKP